jgi:type IV pilus assembly protein PilY1
MDGDGAAETLNARITSNTPANYTSGTMRRGWYLDLTNTDLNPLDNKGERQITDAVLRGGKIIFTTLLPSGDSCDPINSSWLMELDAIYGRRLTFSPFDFNYDNSFNSGDYVNAGDLDGDGSDDYVAVSGLAFDTGTSTPGIVTGPKVERKYLSGEDASIYVVRENPGNREGRISWEQMR